MSETETKVDRKDHNTVEYDGPAGGWGSLKGIARIFGKEWATPAALDTLRRQNKPKGFMCVSCSWAKPADYHTFEFCENGAKATLWELTTRRCTPEFFAKHTVSELRNWNDYDLEQQGRLTHPMRYDLASDRYVRVGRSVRGDRLATQISRSAIGRLLFLGAGKPRDFLSLCVVRTPVRLQ